jgi:hypothetical protein
MLGLAFGASAFRPLPSPISAFEDEVKYLYSFIGLSAATKAK